MISGGEIVGEMDGTQSGPIEVQAGEIGNDAGTGISPQDIEAREDRGEEDTEMLIPRLRWKQKRQMNRGKQRLLRLARRMRSRPLQKTGYRWDLNIDLPIAAYRRLPSESSQPCSTAGGIRSAKRQAGSLARRKHWSKL